MSYLFINLDTSVPQTGPSLLFGLFEYVQFDAVSESTNRRSSEVTQHPVEEGSVIADHVTPSPRELDLVGVISNVPASFVDWTARFGTTYMHDMYDQLNRWMDNGTAITVLAVGDYYEAMELVSMERGHDHTKGQAAHLHLGWQEIEVVATRTVDAPTPKTARAATRKSKGQKAVKTSESSAADESLLESIGGVLF